MESAKRPSLNDAMTDTPRLRSAFPTSRKNANESSLASPNPASNNSKPAVSTSSPAVSDDDAPLIPFDILDGPSQRFSVAVAFASLAIWRLYDHHLAQNEAQEALWLFMKWIAIDSAFIFGLPKLRVPWLQWPSWFTYTLFLMLAALDAMLMFDIGLPWQAWLIALTKYFYDRELAVDGVRVKRGNILHNSSLILGRQIVHILPEGSATLNPDHLPLCLGHSGGPINLPIVINQTTPTLVEILRLDFDSDTTETITLHEKDLKRLKKRADKESGTKDPATPRTLNHAIKKPGLYKLMRVVDRSKLEVQRRMSDTLVVDCPSAFVRTVPPSRCKGDLSDFNLVVRATPPFKVRFSKTINTKDSGSTSLTIHPENLVSPLAWQKFSNALVSLDPSEHHDLSWARSQSILVPLNESLSTSGGWSYAIDEVQDAVGNVVSYDSEGENPHRQNLTAQGDPLQQTFEVHDRPRAQFEGCNSDHGLKAEKGKSKEMLLRLGSTGQSPKDALHEVSYAYRPFADTGTSELSHEMTSGQAKVLGNGHGFVAKKPGLYSLVSVSAGSCFGEILEPSSCLLTNPPEPGLEIRSQPISDVCAKKSVGLLVNLDLTGTPPFRLSYNIRSGRNRVSPEVMQIDRLHTQNELKPSSEGHYVYEFLHLSDAVYQDPRPLHGPQYILEQNVKPGVNAHIIQSPNDSRIRCLDEPFSVSVQLRGEGPWLLNYEIIHNGRRRKQQETDITNDFHSLDIGPVSTGGIYTIALTSVVDSTGCKISLGEETHVEVSQSRPKAAFGKIDGSYGLAALEDHKIKLPLRLQGAAPWTVEFVNLDRPHSAEKVTLQDQNSYIEVQHQGTYELTQVSDASCPGTVSTSANQFKIDWIPRPAVSFSESPSVRRKDGKYFKDDVCEGDQDAADVIFKGAPPFAAEYDRRLQPEHGGASVSTKKISVGLNHAALQLDTAKAGLHEYEFTKLEDNSYGHNPKRFSPIKLHQYVHSLPSASFADARKTYKHCKEADTTGEAITIMMVGLPPFSLEVAIQQHAQAKPEIIRIPHIDDNRYDFQVPHGALALGTHSVTIQKVRDARGCQRSYDYDGPSVQISVADIPGISPVEAKSDYCVGEYIEYTLTGTPPFTVFYNFDGQHGDTSSATTNFRRVAEKPGVYTITGISDQRSKYTCKAKVNIAKEIHQMPNVWVNKGRTSTADIHEGGVTEIPFEFGGTPPFEFTLVSHLAL